MLKQWFKLIALLIALVPWPAQALLTIEITGGSEAALPIAIVPFGVQGYAPPENKSFSALLGVE